jgi:hypothetical protein
VSGDLARYERAVIAAERALAQRDSALALLAERDATIAQVRALCDSLPTSPRTSKLATMWDLLRALDGTP